MTVKRRSPGQRRRRSRRDEELAQVASVDPAKHAELLELRRYNPQAYRKELARLIRAGTIERGRGFEVPSELLASIDPSADAKAVVTALDAAAEAGDLGFRTTAGLLQAERAGADRASVVSFLERRYDALLETENRSGARVTRTR